MIAPTRSAYASSSMSKPPRSARSTSTGSMASTTSATENSCSVSTSTTTNGVPSSCAANPRSRICRNGTARSRSATCPSSGTPVSSGTSSSDSTTRRVPPTRPTVCRSPARVERRMIAHAWCARSAAIASRALGSVVMPPSSVGRGGRSTAVSKPRSPHVLDLVQVAQHRLELGDREACVHLPHLPQDLAVRRTDLLVVEGEGVHPGLAPVTGIRRALHQTLCLEPVQDAGGRARRKLGRLCKLPRGHRLAVAQENAVGLEVHDVEADRPRDALIGQDRGGDHLLHRAGDLLADLLAGGQDGWPSLLSPHRNYSVSGISRNSNSHIQDYRTQENEMVEKRARAMGVLIF